MPGEESQPARVPFAPAGGTAIVLTGGGARAAYQVGLLRCLARRAPGTRFSVVSGVSAGAINAAYLASHPGTIAEAAAELSRLWSELTFEQVFRVDAGWLARNFMRWTWSLVSGGSRLAPEVRGLMSTEPLRCLLQRELRAGRNEPIEGIARNIVQGRLRAAALLTVNYGTGQTETWVQGSEILDWKRPNRRSRTAHLSVEHVMASAALPLVFPAVQLDGAWYGDGGIRMAAPLAPAVHLGAERILAISTRYARSHEEAERDTTTDYPSPAQIAGNLLNAVFLDALDRDVRVCERINALIRKVPPHEREGMRPIDVLVLRPSEDLGKLAGEYEPRLPKSFRHLTRGLGTRRDRSPDFLSLLMFQPDYLQRLIAIGERDAEARHEEIAELLRERGQT